MDQTKSIKLNDLLEYSKTYRDSYSFRLAQNSLLTNRLIDLCFDHLAFQNWNDEFSNTIRTNSTKITDQQQSGRCWIFATLNPLRDALIKEYNLEEFEFSQAYLAFWDKLERCNTFLTHMIENIKADFSEDHIDHLLLSHAGDGGFLSAASQLIAKYGLVPKKEMEDSYSAANTKKLVQLLEMKLKQAYFELKENAYSPIENLYAIKRKYLSELYRILVYCYGKVPTKFDVTLKPTKESKKKPKTFKNISPLEFAKKINFEANDIHEVVCSPYKKIKPFNKYVHNFRVIYENGDCGFITVDKEAKMLMILAMLFQQKSLYFACDVNFYFNTTKGACDPALYKFEEFLGIDFCKDQDKMIEMLNTSMNHAMTLSGFDYVEAEWNKIKNNFFAKRKNQKLGFNDLKHLISLFPVKKFLVENSWGEKYGNKGLFTMSKAWFDDFVNEFMISKKAIYDFFLNPKFLKPKEYQAFTFAKTKIEKAKFVVEELINKPNNKKPIQLGYYDPVGKWLGKIK